MYFKKNDKDKTALSKYKELRKSVSYANRYAVVKGLKDSQISSMNDGTISGYKKAISFLIDKNQPISGSDRGFLMNHLTLFGNMVRKNLFIKTGQKQSN